MSIFTWGVYLTSGVSAASLKWTPEELQFFALPLWIHLSTREVTNYLSLIFLSIQYPAHKSPTIHEYILHGSVFVFICIIVILCNSIPMFRLTLPFSVVKMMIPPLCALSGADPTGLVQIIEDVYLLLQKAKNVFDNINHSEKP